MTNKHTSIRTRLMLSYGLFVILIFIIGAVAIYSIYGIYYNGKYIFEDNLQSVSILHGVGQNVREINLCVRDGLEDYSEDVDHKINRLRKENNTFFKKYENLKTNDMEKRRYKQCRLSMIGFDRQVDEVLKLMKAGETDAAKNKFYQELTPIRACTYEFLDAVVELAERNAEARYQDNQNTFSNILYVAVCLIVLSFWIAVGISVYTNRLLKKRLVGIGLLAERLAEYDLSEDIGDVAQDEFGEITQSLNGAQLMLRDLLTKIVEESADMAAISFDVSEAVSRTGGKIEKINLIIYDTADALEKIEKINQELISKVKEEDIDHVTNTVKVLQEQRIILEQIQSELTNIITNMSQIGIIAGQQNEISELHKEQIDLFKISNSDY